MISKIDSGRDRDSRAGFQPARAQRRLGAELTLAERDARQCLDDGENHDARIAASQALSSRVLHELFDADASIYTKLAARLRSCRPKHGDLQALAPCAEVDALLSRVVSIIQGDYAAHAGDWQRHAARDADMERLVRVTLEQRIAAEPRLRARARCVRRAAGLAETAMEQHFGRRLLAELQALREPFALQPVGPSRTALLESCLALANFPYARNYRLLTLAELRLLRQSAPPRLLRAADAARLPLTQRERFEAELSQLRVRSRAQAIWALCLSPVHSVAVCGSGPLPLSGLMLHALTAARVSLIERDASAVAISRALLRELERLQVLTPGAVEVVHADVAEHTPRAHVVLVASLVDQPAKLQLVQRLREQRTPLQALLLRSASSLCAELAYEPVDTLLFTDPSLPFVGECMPGATAQNRSEQLVSSAREVLNDTELYRPVAPSAAEPSWLREQLIQLRAAAHEDLHG